MVANGPTITAAEYETWLPPSAALAMLRHIGSMAAKEILFNRLCYGLLKSAAKEAQFQGDPLAYALVSSKEWKHAEKSILRSLVWSGGDITIPIPQISRAYGPYTSPLALFGVRFDPDGIKELLPPKSKVISAEPISMGGVESSARAEPASTAAPVAEDHLKGWFDVYRRAYPKLIEDHALISARGMFHDKSVTRQRVRGLLGPRKRGRKPKDGE